MWTQEVLTPMSVTSCWVEFTYRPYSNAATCLPGTRYFFSSNKTKLATKTSLQCFSNHKEIILIWSVQPNQFQNSILFELENCIRTLIHYHYILTWKTHHYTGQLTPPVMSWRILLAQFYVCMPLLMETSAFRLGRRHWSFPQQC